MLSQKFIARRGKGSTYNGTKIHVSEQKELANALLMAEFGTNRSEDKVKNIMDNLTTLVPKCHGIRCLGGAVLNICMVALGGADAAYDFGAHAWDYAAAEFIVREAGGIVMDPSGGPLDLMSRRLLAASSNELAIELSKTLTQYYPDPRDDA
jgi:myo-inositol-1(or 4)-monophosphatase